VGRTTFLDNLLHIFYMIRIGFSRSPHGLHVSFPRARFAFRFFKRRPAHSAATFVRPCGTPRINCFLQHRQIPHIKAKRNDVTFVLNQDGDSCKKKWANLLIPFLSSYWYDNGKIASCTNIPQNIFESPPFVPFLTPPRSAECACISRNTNIPREIGDRDFSLRLDIS